MVVNTAFDKRRMEYDVAIGYGDSIERAKELLHEALNETEGVLKQPPADVLVMELAPSSVTIRVRWWITPPKRAHSLDARDCVLAAVKKKLQENGIDIPFPTQQILFHDQTEETDGDRLRQREGWPAGRGGAPRPAAVARSSSRTAGGPGKGCSEVDARPGGER